MRHSNESERARRNADDRSPFEKNTYHNTVSPSSDALAFTLMKPKGLCHTKPTSLLQYVTHLRYMSWLPTDFAEVSMRLPSRNIATSSSLTLQRSQL